MKRNFLLLLVAHSSWLAAISQNIGIGTNNPQNKLHVAGGFRLDTLVGVGGSGLLRHDANGVVYGIKFTGSVTDVLRGDGTFGSSGSGSVGWLLNGNSGTDPANNFIGTTDGQPLIFKVKNSMSGIIDSAKGNASLGFLSLPVNGGTFNSAFGYRTLSVNAGQENAALGDYALTNNTSGADNVAVGSGALFTNTTGSLNTAVGPLSALDNTTGNYNVAIGSDALELNTEQSNLVAVGDHALFHNGSGQANTAVGSKALYSDESGSNNTSLGFKALYSNILGNDNTAVGVQSLYSNTASGNSAFGDGALFKNISGINNNAFGLGALVNNVQGTNNSAFGSFSLEQSDGDYNSAFGGSALSNNTTGYNNTAGGASSSYHNTTGQGNVALGYQALYTNITGDVNTAIGAQADVIFGNQINTTLIGHFAKASSSNKVRIGNAAVTVVEGQVAYTYPSDGRFKTNISEDIKGLDFIMRLRPVSYNFQTKKYEAFINGGEQNAKAFSKIDFTESENLRHNGFIAQEVEKAAKDAGYKFDGITSPKNDRDTYGLAYSQFVVPLVRAVQEQQTIIERQQQQINDLLKRVQALEKK